eukprot:5978259-Alexandrium_andersonii.AAC.1
MNICWRLKFPGWPQGAAEAASRKPRKLRAGNRGSSRQEAKGATGRKQQARSRRQQAVASRRRQA